MVANLNWVRNGQELRLTIVRQEIRVGRGASCQIRGDSDQLADTHCRIANDGSAFIVEHVAGVPTLVNGIPIARHALADGDVIECPHLAIRFSEKRRRPTVGPPPQPVAVPNDVDPVAVHADRDGWIRERDDLLEQRAALKRERDELDSELRRLRSKLELRDADVVRHEQEMLGLRRSLDRGEGEVTVLTEHLQAREQRIADLTAELAMLNASLDTAEKQLRTESSHSRSLQLELDQREARAKELFDESLALRKEVEREREDRRQIQAQLGNLSQDNVRLQQNLSRTTNLLAETQQANQRLQVDVQAIMTRCSEYEEIIRSREDEVLVTSEARSHVQGLYQDLQTRHHAAEVAHAIEKGSRERFSRENIALRDELARVQAEIQRVLRERVSDTELARALAENEALRKELADSHCAAIRLRQEHETSQAVRATIEAYARDQRSLASSTAAKQDEGERP